jgi:hypothetical protein
MAKPRRCGRDNKQWADQHQHETPLTDQLEEALAFFRMPLSWTHNPHQSDPIVNADFRGGLTCLIDTQCCIITT